MKMEHRIFVLLRGLDFLLAMPTSDDDHWWQQATKSNILRENKFSINMITEDNLWLADYFGNTNGEDGEKADKAYEAQGELQNLSHKRYPGGHALTQERFDFIIKWIGGI